MRRALLMLAGFVSAAGVGCVKEDCTTPLGGTVPSLCESFELCWKEFGLVVDPESGESWWVQESPNAGFFMIRYPQKIAVDVWMVDGFDPATTPKEAWVEAIEHVVVDYEIGHDTSDGPWSDHRWFRFEVDSDVHELTDIRMDADDDGLRFRTKAIGAETTGVMVSDHPQCNDGDLQGVCYCDFDGSEIVTVVDIELPFE